MTLRLPIEQVTGITRYRLESPDGNPVDPRSNNRQQLNVVIGSRTIDPALFAASFVIDAETGGEAGGLPPGSLNLFVFDMAAQAPGDGGGDDTGGDGDGDEASEDEAADGGGGDDGSEDSGGGGVSDAENDEGSSGGCFILAAQMVE